MSRYVEILDNRGIDYTAIISDIASNLSRSMFKHSSVYYATVFSAEEDDYVAIESRDIIAFLNGEEAMLTEDLFTFCSATVEEEASQKLSDLLFVEFGNKLLLDNVEQIVAFEKTLHTSDNLVSTIYDRLIDLIFYLFADDPRNTYRALDNLNKAYKNAISENRNKEPVRSLVSGTIKPMSL